jgi:hypothetical protein
VHIFWEIEGVPNNSEAQDEARRVLGNIGGIRGVAQGYHNKKGVYHVTLYYDGHDGRRFVESYRRQIENGLCPLFGQQIKASEAPS